MAALDAILETTFFSPIILEPTSMSHVSYLTIEGLKQSCEQPEK